MGKPTIKDNTPAEERAIQRQVAEDPYTWPTAPDTQVIRRGRPIGKSKAQVSVRLDFDVLAALKQPDEKGWQTRMNRHLRDSLKLGKREANKRSHKHKDTG
jgi:uncharacterized protein (DUF4415 family)